MRYVLALILISILIFTSFNLSIFQSDYQSGSRMRVGDVTLELEIASTTEAREKGLSSRKSLGENQGMLFVFERPAKYSFWMKEMNFPIDMIWLDGSFKVTGLKVGATPDSYPATFSPERDSLYVLETNVGLIKSKNLKLGTQLQFIK